MAIAMRSVGVKPGYKARRVTAHPAAKSKSAFWVRFLLSLRSNAREMQEFVVDEIVYATMDTARVWEYLRYELGFRTRSRITPVTHELETFVQEHDVPELGALIPGQVRVRAK